MKYAENLKTRVVTIHDTTAPIRPNSTSVHTEALNRSAISQPRPNPAASTAVRTGLTVGLALGQIGEFSFILIALARDLKVVPPEALDIAVAVAIASITINPLTFKVIDPRLVNPRTEHWDRAFEFFRLLM